VKDLIKEIDGFTKRYIHTHNKQAMRQLARDWLAWLGWDFRANASADTLLVMLLDESLRRTRTLYVMNEVCDNERAN
jgi:hypothetical protein